MDAPTSPEQAALDEADRKIKAWIGEHVGGEIVHFERQSRWRGGWWVSVERCGELLKLYVREERKEEFPPWPLEHEADVLEILGASGVPAPRIYGICPDPHAIIMEALPGTTSLRDLKTPESQRVFLHDLAEAIARMHAIDPQQLADRGFPMPQSAEETSLACFPLCDAMFLKAKKHPDPRMEFLRRWIYRNVPRQRDKVSIIAVDSGQVMQHQGRVSGLFDMEYACLGDPWTDLAFIPARMFSEGIDDVQPFYEHYQRVTGERVDPAIVTFHRVWFGLATPLTTTKAMETPTAQSTYFDYIFWYISPVMGCFLAIAQSMGLDLDTRLDVPPPQPSRWAKIIDVMEARIPPAQPGEPYAMAEQRKFMEFMRRVDAHRDVEDEYLGGVADILGQPVSDWAEADRLIEKFVMTAGPEHDERLVRLFHRWLLAQAKVLLDGAPEYNQISYLHRPFPNYAELLA